MLLSCEKTRDMLVHVRKKPCTQPPLTVDGTETEKVSEAKLLGVVNSDTLGRGAQVD